MAEIGLFGCVEDAARPDPPGAPDMHLRPAVDAGGDARSPDGPPLRDAAPPPPDACVPREEVCGGGDDDCDGRVDEGLGFGPLGPPVVVAEDDELGPFAEALWATEEGLLAFWRQSFMGQAPTPNLYARRLDALGRPLAPAHEVVTQSVTRGPSEASPHLEGRGRRAELPVPSVKIRKIEPRPSLAPR